LSEGTTTYYQNILVAAGMRRSTLRPDFLLLLENPFRLLMVEAKQSRLEDVTPDRRGILEAMAYIRDCQDVLVGLPPPHALVVGWNATGKPAVSPIVVSDQGSVGVAVDLILDQWSVAATAPAA
jgi:hypothetical protein